MTIKMNNEIIETEDGIQYYLFRGKVDFNSPQPIVEFNHIHYEIKGSERIPKKNMGKIQLLPENIHDVVATYFLSDEWIEIEDSERSKMEEFLIANGFRVQRINE